MTRPTRTGLIALREMQGVSRARDPSRLFVEISKLTKVHGARSGGGRVVTDKLYEDMQANTVVTMSRPNKTKLKARGQLSVDSHYVQGQYTHTPHLKIARSDPAGKRVQ